MAITYVGSASAASNSVSLPSFQAGDVALVLVQNSSSTTAVTAPSGWGIVYSIAGTSSYTGLAYRVLQTGDTSTGTWTNATGIGLVVYRGAHTGSPIEAADWSGTTGYASFSENSGSWNLIGPTSKARSASTTYVAMMICSSGAINALTDDGHTTRTSGVSWSGFLAGDGTTSPGWYGTTSVNEALYIEFYLREPNDGLYPIVSDVDTTSGTVTSNSSSWTLTYPTNIAAGDLLVALVASDGASSYVTAPSGWESFYGVAANSLSVVIRSASGSETGTFTFNLGVSEQGSWAVYRIPSGTWLGGTPSSGSTTRVDSTQVDRDYFSIWMVSSDPTPTANPDPPSLNPANWDAGYTLWIAAMSADTSRTVSAYPSSPDTFTNTGSLVSGGSGGATLAWGRLEKNASSVDPGTFTISNSDDWAAATIAIRGDPVRTGSFKADAYIVSSGGPQTIPGSFSASADIFKTQSGSFSASAVILRNSGTLTFTADSLVLKPQSDSFSVDAVIFATQPGSFTASADIKREQTGSFSASSVVLRNSGTLTFTADAFIQKVQQNSFTASAVIKATVPGSFVADAIRLKTWVFGSGSTVIGQDDFSTDYASLAGNPLDIGGNWSLWYRTSGTGVLQAFSGYFTGASGTTGDVMYRAGTGTDGDADHLVTDRVTVYWPDENKVGVFVRGVSAGTQYELQTVGGSGYYRLYRRTSGALTQLGEAVDAYDVDCRYRVLVSGSSPTTFKVRSWATSGSEGSSWDIETSENTSSNQTAAGAFGIIGHKGTSTSSAGDDYVVYAGLGGSVDGPGPTADAVIAKTQTGSFSVSAVVKATQTGSATASSIVLRQQPGSFSADSYIAVTQTGSFTADAFFALTVAGTLDADAVVLATQSGSFSADAYIGSISGGSITANAVVLRTQQGTATADAFLVATRTGSFSASSVIARTQPGSFSASAVIKAAVPGSFVADAIRLRTWVFGASEPTTVAQDSFTEAGTGTADLSTHTAEVGGTWSRTWAEPWVQWSIDKTNDRATLGGSTIGADPVVYAIASIADGYAQVNTNATTRNLDQSGVVVRQVTDNVDTLYTCYGGSLYRITNNSWTSLSSIGGSGSWYRLQGTGNSPTALKVERRTTQGALGTGWLLETTDNTAANQTTTGYVGIYGWEQDDGDGGTRYSHDVDDFLAVELGGGADFPGPTADAVISKTQTGLLAASAVIKRTQTGSATSDAVLFRTQQGSFVASAVIAKTTSGALSGDAVVRRTSSYSFGADAIVQRLAQASLTTDAIVLRSLTTNASADATIQWRIIESASASAVIRSTVESSFSASACLAKTESGSASADAFFVALRTDSATADAAIDPAWGDWSDIWENPVGQQAGTIYAYSVIQATSSGDLTVDAFFQKIVSGDLSSDAVISSTGSGSASSDAVIAKSQSGSLDASAVIQKTLSGSLSADSVIKREQAGSFTADAAMVATQDRSLSVSAIVRREQSGSFVSDSVIKKTQDRDLTSDAVVSASGSGSFSASAVVRREQSGSLFSEATIGTSYVWSLTAQSVLLGEISGSLTADAFVALVSSKTFTADSNIAGTSSGSFTADAWVAAPGYASFSADAALFASKTLSFTSDAVFSVSRSWTFTAESTLVSAFFGNFTARSIVQRTQTGTFTTDGLVSRTTSATFSGSAVISRVASAAFTADAAKLKSSTGALTADAVVSQTRTGGFASDAIFRSVINGSLSADAWVFGEAFFAFSADAVILAAGSGSLVASSVLARVQSWSVTADAWIGSSPSGSLTADAVVAATGQGSLGVEASILKTQDGSVSADAYVQSTNVGLLLVDAAISLRSLGGLTTDAVLLAGIARTFSANASITDWHLGNIEATSTAETIGSTASASTLGSTFSAAQISSSNAALTIEATASAGTLAFTILKIQQRFFYAEAWIQ